MDQQTGMQAAAQAGIEDFSGIFRERLRGIVREGLLSMFCLKKVACPFENKLALNP